MKKSIIATGAASLALAAMPIVGVFADTYTSSVTDTLTVNIPESCTIGNSNIEYSATEDPASENNYVVTMKNGQLREDIGGGTADGTDNDNVFTVTCNIQSGNTDPNADTWVLTAMGLNGQTTLAGKTGTTAEGYSIATGTGNSTSGWAFKVTITNGSDVDYSTGYNSNFQLVPGTATPIVEGSGEATLTTLYRVFIDANQKPGTYEGGVVYTLTNPAD